MADTHGRATPELAKLYLNLVRGGVGLIITGHAYISPEGMASPHQLGIYSDDLIDDLKAMTDAIHDEGGNLVVQISHSGCHGAYRLNGLCPLGPSVMKNHRGPDCKELSIDGIQKIVEGFTQAAVRAEKAGFDGVQLHAAHGYLLSQFLSPFYNKREDAFGGDLENRVRIILEIIRSIKSVTGGETALLVKMNSEDFLDNGLTIEEMLGAAAMLEKAGVDAIELSGGTIHSPIRYNAIRKGVIKTKDQEVYYRNAAMRYKERIHIPLMLVGGIRSYEVAEELINNGITDYISMSRPLICEPDLINKWRSGDRKRSDCLNDNMCFTPAIRGRGLRCAVKERKK
jgi:2,4-dienoyl-CoA reductase-like NADH-dependent reductase (Old Yellow Enzyme family)